jgi:hypothetical protein
MQLKLERIWEEISSLTPSGLQFGSDPVYDDRVRRFKDLLDALPGRPCDQCRDSRSVRTLDHETDGPQIRADGAALHPGRQFVPRELGGQVGAVEAPSAQPR